MGILAWTDDAVMFHGRNNTGLSLGYNGMGLLSIDSNSVTIGGNYSPQPTILLNGKIQVKSATGQYSTIHTAIDGDINMGNGYIFHFTNGLLTGVN